MRPWPVCPGGWIRKSNGICVHLLLGLLLLLFLFLPLYRAGPLSLATDGSLVSLWLLLFPFAPYLSLPSPVPLCYRLPPGFVSVGWDWAGEKLGYRVVSAPTPRMAGEQTFDA